MDEATDRDHREAAVLHFRELHARAPQVERVEAKVARLLKSTAGAIVHLLPADRFEREHQQNNLDEAERRDRPDRVERVGFREHAIRGRDVPDLREHPAKSREHADAAVLQFRFAKEFDVVVVGETERVKVDVARALGVCGLRQEWHRARHFSHHAHVRRGPLGDCRRAAGLERECSGADKCGRHLTTKRLLSPHSDRSAHDVPLEVQTKYLYCWNGTCFRSLTDMHLDDVHQQSLDVIWTWAEGTRRTPGAALVAPAGRCRLH
mmetsp:Transcript_13806/g.37057  ORF Transcript_13806/g.37057 Transcript_13806/m.37057 type:complete len:264 (+) Transcript_13806:274-1065(+)